MQRSLIDNFLFVSYSFMRSDHLSKHLKIHKKNSFNQQNQVKQENDSENGTSISGLMD